MSKQVKNSVDYFDVLPRVLTSYIFTFLDTKSICSFMFLSKKIFSAFYKANSRSTSEVKKKYSVDFCSLSTCLYIYGIRVGFYYGGIMYAKVVTDVERYWAFWVNHDTEIVSNVTMSYGCKFIDHETGMQGSFDPSLSLSARDFPITQKKCITYHKFKSIKFDIPQSISDERGECSFDINIKKQILRKYSYIYREFDNDIKIAIIYRGKLMYLNFYVCGKNLVTACGTWDLNYQVKIFKTLKNLPIYEPFKPARPEDIN